MHAPRRAVCTVGRRPPASPQAIRLARLLHLARGMDLVALGIVAVFFALSWGFVRLCERL